MDDFFRSVERFVSEQIKPHINDWDEAGEFPRDLYKQAGALGLLGLGYPEEVGGFECTLADRLKLSNLVCTAGSGGLLAGLFSHNNSDSRHETCVSMPPHHPTHPHLSA